MGPRPATGESSTRLSEAAALNLARWHRACSDALGLASLTEPRLWACPDPRHSFSAAVTLGPAPAKTQLSRVTERMGSWFARPGPWVALCDSWNALALEPFGFQVEESKAWMLREPKTGPKDGWPSGLEVVIPEARRRGFGEALTWTATLWQPDVPALLQPSEEGEVLYRRMGYAPLSESTVWTRRASIAGRRA